MIRLGDGIGDNLQRVALFGGMFDPPHNGHVAFIRAAIDSFKLDQVFIVVTASPPHRSDAIAPIEKRLEMSRDAFASIEKATVVEWESQATAASAPTYSIDTLEYLAGEFSEAELMLLVGADQLVALEKWHRWSDIVAIATIGVAIRPGVDANAIEKSLESLAHAGARVLRCEMEPIDIDSTHIRDNAAQGDIAAAKRDVPDDVSHAVEAIYAGGAANSTVCGVH